MFSHRHLLEDVPLPSPTGSTSLDFSGALLSNTPKDPKHPQKTAPPPSKPPRDTRPPKNPIHPERQR